MEEKAIVFDSEDEADILFDFLIYEKNKKGIRLIDTIYDSSVELSDLEEEILEGMVNHKSSFFEVKNIDPYNCILELIDLLENKQNEYKLIDMGLSKSCKKGLIIFLRLIPIKELYMTSGILFVFNPSEKNKILSEISFKRLKLRRKLNSTELLVLAHKKNKQFGNRVQVQDIRDKLREEEI